MNASDRVMARRWLGLLIQDSRAIEVRIDTGRGWCGGWFDNVDAIARVAGEYRYCSIYTTINRPNSYKLTNSVSWDYDRFADTNVSAVMRLFYDFDPERQSGVPATSGEMLMAKERAFAFRQDMTALGWPQPALGASGNGVHLMYRSRMVSNDDFHDPNKRLYEALSAKYSDHAVTVDVTVRSAGQLTRLYGSTNFKGTATGDRPHRLSSIWVPEDYEFVRLPMYQSAVAHYGADKEPEKARTQSMPGGSHRPAGSGDYSTLDVVSWFVQEGLYLRHIKDNLHGVTCPWVSAHSCNNFNDTVVRECTDGKQWPSFQCKHAHCSGRTITDVMQVLGDPDAFCSKQFGGHRHG